MILSIILCSVSLVHSLRATLATTLFTLFLHCIFSFSLTHSLCKFHFRFVVALAFIVVFVVASHWLTRHCLVCGVHQHYAGGQIAVVALVIVVFVVVIVVGHISHTHRENSLGMREF